MSDKTSKIRTIRVAVKGVSPLLMNPMTDATLEELRTKVRVQRSKDISLQEEAGQKLYKNDTGKIGIPMVNLISCLAEAGRKVKNGKGNISTADSSTIYGFMNIEDEFFSFSEEDSAWVPDKRRGVMTKDKIAVCIVRPKFKQWGFETTITIDEAECAVETVKRLFETAGKYVGLCDFRPKCNGPFGRFKVDKWKVVE